MDRRHLLSLIAGTVALPTLARAVPLPPPQPHRLNLVNAHTHETFSGIYRDDNGPIPRVMEELSVFLRDFRADEKIGIDVDVLDFLSKVMQSAGQAKATILSAYRTPETNAMLAKKGLGAAENSQHLYGRALDIHFGEKLADTMKAARAMQLGGVGWYPNSNFIHIDSGPVRNWDLNHKDRGTLLVGGKKIHFDKKGRILLAKGNSHQVAGGKTAAAHTPTVIRGNGPPSVRERMTRLRQLARAEYFARHH